MPETSTAAPSAAPAAEPTLGNFQAIVRNAHAAQQPAAASPPGAPAGPPVAGDAATPATDSLAAQRAITEAAAGQAEQPAAAEDLWAEQVHGMTAREIVDAIKKGVVPEALRVALRDTTPDGLQITLDELRHGYMRMTDSTKKWQEAAALNQQGNKMLMDTIGLFDTWQDPQKFADGVARVGLAPVLRQVITKDWGTEQQPNVAGYLDSMRRLDHFGTFRAAAIAYAERHNQLMHQFNPAGDAALAPRAEAMIEDLERREQSLWSERIKMERTAEGNAKVQHDARKKAYLARMEQERQSSPEVSRLSQHMEAHRDRAFQQFGLDATPLAMQHFDHNLSVIIQMASSNGARESVEELVAHAAQATAEEVGAHRQEHAPVVQQVPAPAQPAPGLSARPGGAPSNGAARTRGGTVADFRKQVLGGGY